MGGVEVELEAICKGEEKEQGIKERKRVREGERESDRQGEEEEQGKNERKWGK